MKEQPTPTKPIAKETVIEILKEAGLAEKEIEVMVKYYGLEEVEQPTPAPVSVEEAAEKYCLKYDFVCRDNGIVGEPFDDIYNAFIAGAQLQSAPKQSAGVWVKASERLPDKVELYFCRCNVSGTSFILKQLSVFYPDHKMWHVDSKTLTVVEWLDEGQQLQSQQQPNLFQKKEVTLHSGEVSDWKIDCDALTDEDLDCLAYLVSKQIDFSRVVGVPKGGDRFAEALRKYRNYKQPPKGERSIIILCDDVLTTGKSMEEKRQELINIDGNPADKIKGIVIFAREKCDDWITPIFSLQSQQQSKQKYYYTPDNIDDTIDFDGTGSKVDKAQVASSLNLQSQQQEDKPVWTDEQIEQMAEKQYPTPSAPFDKNNFKERIGFIKGLKYNGSEDKIAKAIGWCEERLIKLNGWSEREPEQYEILKEMKQFLQSLASK